MKRIFALVLSLVLLTSPICYAAPYNPAFEGHFRYTSAFKNGIALVSGDAGSGVIDTNGSFILPMDASAKCIRKNGLIMVLGENRLAAFFDKTGKQLTDYVYDVYPYTHPKTDETTYPYFTNRFDGDGATNLIPVSRNGKFGFINSKAEEVIAPQFEYAYGFSDGIARICAEGEMGNYGIYVNGKYGFIRVDGSILLPANTYWIAGDFKNGYASVSNTTESYKMMDKNGTIIDLEGNSFVEKNGIYIVVQNAAAQTAVLDMQKNVVVPFDERTKELFHENILIGCTQMQNRDGAVLYTAPENTTIHASYTDSSTLTNYIALHCAQNGQFGEKLYGLADVNGNVILPPIYNAAFVLGDGLLYAQTDAENFLFDTNGNLICKLNGNDPGYVGNHIFSLLDFDTMTYSYYKNPMRDIPVLYNGAQIKFDVPPLLENGRTLVPLRAIFETLGATVAWDETTFTVTAARGDTEIRLTIGENVLYKNNIAIPMDTYARLEDARTLIPLRAVSEAFGCNVDWDDAARTVYMQE